jgi:hypothetical protein
LDGVSPSSSSPVSVGDDACAAAATSAVGDTGVAAVDVG